MSGIDITTEGVTYSPDTCAPITTKDVIHQLRWMKDTSGYITGAEDEISRATRESAKEIFKAYRDGSVIDAGDLLFPSDKKLSVLLETWRGGRYNNDKTYVIVFQMINDDGSVRISPSILLAHIAPEATQVSVIAPLVLNETYGLGLESHFRAFACEGEAVEFEAMKLNEKKPPETKYLLNLFICLLSALYDRPEFQARQ